MLKNIYGIFIACSVLLAASCSKKGDTAPVADTIITYKAVLSGASEVPANASTGSGTATITLNATTKIMTVVVNFTGVTATASHIHQAAAGTNGSIIFPFVAPITSPINYTSAPIDALQEAILNASGYYVNVHSATYPGGEIRGQIIKQ